MTSSKVLMMKQTKILANNEDRVDYYQAWIETLDREDRRMLSMMLTDFLLNKGFYRLVNRHLTVLVSLWGLVKGPFKNGGLISTAKEGNSVLTEEDSTKGIRCLKTNLLGRKHLNTIRVNLSKMLNF